MFQFPNIVEERVNIHVKQCCPPVSSLEGNSSFFVWPHSKKEGSNVKLDDAFGYLSWQVIYWLAFCPHKVFLCVFSIEVVPRTHIYLLYCIINIHGQRWYHASVSYIYFWDTPPPFLCKNKYHCLETTSFLNDKWHHLILKKNWNSNDFFINVVNHCLNYIQYTLK